MRLSWNEMRTRAATFAKEWREAAYEKGETRSFYNNFFDIFGVRRRTVARYEKHVKRFDSSSGYIDLFWPCVLLVEQKSAGRDLTKAYGQAGDYFDALPERDRLRYILASDFQTFELHDLDERGDDGFRLADLYDPGLMSPNLRKAHTALDRAVDRLYRPGGFASERERVKHLFGLYEKMTVPLEARMKGKSRRRSGT